MKHKFNIGDIVYTIYNNKIIRCVVNGIKIDLSQKSVIKNDTVSIKYFDETEYCLVEVLELTKTSTIVKMNGTGFIIKEEDYIFSSIEELINAAKLGM